ncbi:hypothetical protein Cwoe_0297 [Conexibacter woesei DSM 14684]|uniref:GerMN domain-containing protein n=1 Tax=Conexibacter woesei (strain DSM 14684 / CCUG 47730 / CIP 108061 / JCM 11494 / NBRC 100937 / ID131577) TaxID=469383 RepID=D3F660_CONWI|nr:hypothetical protein Cwoe_0297 [Conexibacter woesei DSM 14684]
MIRRLVAVSAVLAACAALVTAGYLLGGRGVRPTGVIAAGPAPAGIARQGGREIFLLRDGRATPVVRSGRRGGVRGSLAVLFAGPTAAERAHGLRSELPELAPSVRGRLRLRRAGYGELQVDLPARVPALTRRAMRQIACTVVRSLVASGRARDAPVRVVAIDADGRTRGAGDCDELLPQALVSPATQPPPTATAAPSVAPQPTRP